MLRRSAVSILRNDGIEADARISLAGARTRSSTGVKFCALRFGDGEAHGRSNVYTMVDWRMWMKAMLHEKSGIRTSA